MTRGWILVAALAAVGACGDNGDAERRQGGDTTVDDRTREAFRHPAANLDAQGQALFQAGRSSFDFIWQVPKLGPLFNHHSCVGCHALNGRGRVMIGMGPVSEALIRTSQVEGTDAHGGPLAVDGYGTQLQDHATVGLPEVRVTLTWVETTEMFADGELVGMREPRFDVRTPMDEPLPPGMRFSLRIGAPMIGLGLLEAIPEATLQALADPDDANGDGISGRANIVWDPERQVSVVGRFGWKANTASLRVQVGGAFHDDIGMTSYLFPDPDPSALRDLTDLQLDETVFFSSTIAVPAAAPRDDEAMRGRTLFRELGCASCHVPTLDTGEHVIPELANQQIHPYTDLLLHDVGDRLTDARPDYLAEGVEWRTPPLWGIGLAQIVNPGATFMHDGRARTLAEAILWHGGEAMAVREAFRMASRADREALLAFLRTL
jgi:CxxC motif-containing protein (DUF1111 family)